MGRPAAPGASAAPGPPTSGCDTAEYTLEPEEPLDMGVTPDPELLWAEAPEGDSAWMASAVRGATTPPVPMTRDPAVEASTAPDITTPVAGVSPPAPPPPPPVGGKEGAGGLPEKEVMELTEVRLLRRLSTASRSTSPLVVAAPAALAEPPPPERNMEKPSSG